MASSGAGEALDPHGGCRALVAEANTQSPRTETHPRMTKGLLHQFTPPTPVPCTLAHMILPSFALAQAERAQRLR